MSRFDQIIGASVTVSWPVAKSAPRKLSASERLVDEQMLALLEWASDHPDEWHRIGNLSATRKAAELLAKRDVLEIWPETNPYRLKRQK
jgi:hypothetical protein